MAINFGASDVISPLSLMSAHAAPKGRAFMESMSLEQFAELSAGEKIETRPKADKSAFGPFEPNTAYPIEIVNAKSTQSRNGFEQLELEVAIVQPDGSLVSAGRLWETLPLLEHKADELGEEKTTMYRNIFGRNTLGLLRAIEPQLFSVYAKREGKGRGAVYLDHNGEQLSLAERNKRTQAVEAAVVGASKAARDGKLNLQGKRCFLVKVPGSNGRVFQNYYADAPEQYPLANSDQPF